MANIIFGDGINQGDLKDLLDQIAAGWAALLANLDADGTLTDINYASLGTLTAHGVLATGMYQGDLVAFLQDCTTKFNATGVKIDADIGSGTTYTDLAITDIVNEKGSGNIFNDGINQSNVVNLLNRIIVQMKAMATALDSDGGVSKEDYASIFAAQCTDTVDNTGCTD